ncbi:RNA polymerase II associated Paf1 complex subunit Tpr1 [Schizosaccharomyces octosporus yFS286]|uniref:RNA polymerase II associated Paf1 complex subunit Tpr1 n=1 Tax=Schizosaccharomyces octosporus (strain yFS286) TaxID=483514 RepID=S9R401_SCHOY|nr:RNA polymerase II associated Paf1 complex subunit Tpr1 [Schizosaccharomyces octosporus yFS286]EPX73075.1 RNA polymerase II associated Paf1 complex subunit Tpr1 [Schizosaccharomyces octosporus yFS286]
MEGFTIDAHASRIIEVPLLGQEDQTVEIDCASLPEDATELVEILTNEQAERDLWTKFAREYHIRSLSSQALFILTSALNVLKDTDSQCLINANICSIYLHLTRHAIWKQDNVARDQHLQNVRTYLEAANRLNPKLEANVLLHGIYRILLNPLDKDSLENSLRCFDFVLQRSEANVFALIGKARILYSRGNFRGALKLYQRALVSNPQIQPDPRIGIGLCFWNLNMKDDALAAWVRAKELDQNNHFVNTYLGLYYYDLAFENVNSENFLRYYGEALRYTQAAFKAMPSDPVSSCILASYVYSKRSLDGCIKLANTVVQSSFSPSLVADGYFWMGRAYHQMQNYEKAMTCYQRARSVEDRHLLSFLGIGQIQILQNDLTSAKLTFERITEQHPKCAEALIILGCLYASEAKSDFTKPRMLLDRAFNLIGSSKIPRVVDSDLYITQARLWEKEDTKKSLSFLQRAQDFLKSAHISIHPELLNNIGVLNYHLGNFQEAKDYFSAARKEDQDVDPEILLVLDFNLARCEEELGNIDLSMELYTKILDLQPSFADARVRLCLLQLANPQEETFKSIRQLMTTDADNLEVRAFFGWYLSKQKRRPAEDPEVRHCSQTLRHWHDDIYSLVQLGNAYMRQAREIRVQNDKDHSKRQKLYIKAVQSYDQAIKFDPKNAHAAQGIAVTFAHSRQFSKALLILGKIRESIKDVTTLINIGNCLAELKQFSRATEIFETVISMTGEDDVYGILNCLGRVWLQRGREEKRIDFLKESLKYSRMALEKNQENTSLQFNVAFVQFQLSELIYTQPENARTVEDLKFAIQELDDSVKTFSSLVTSKHPPYPPTDIEQRVKMATNTTRKRLERALQQQSEYEASVAVKLGEAKLNREKEKARRLAEEEASRKAQEDRERELEEERKRMQEEVLQWRKNQEKEIEEELSVASDAEDKSSGRKRKGERRKRKSSSKAGKGTNVANEDDTDDDDDDEIPLSDARNKLTKKRRKNKRVISEDYAFDESDNDQQPAESTEGQGENLNPSSPVNESTNGNQKNENDLDNKNEGGLDNLFSDEENEPSPSS